MPKYADVIIDISHEKLDKTFQYIIPEKLRGSIQVGMEVLVPFGRGNRIIRGYVVGLTDVPAYGVSKLKEIDSVSEKGVGVESQLIKLAWWMKVNCGSTMINALKTVLPVKKQIKPKIRRCIEACVDGKKIDELLVEYEKKHFVAKVRLLNELKDETLLDYELVNKKLNIPAMTLKSLEKAGVIKINEDRIYRNPAAKWEAETEYKKLNQAQQEIVDGIWEDENNYKAYLIHGVTGSGKTEIYIELIARAAAMGKQSIVMIPEIALTYQTLSRFYKRFGDRVSIINSKLSQGEKYDQFQRAKNGDIDVIIGPRSALFTPFSNLGYIIIDEEHEGTYKSENVPRYHARDLAIERAGYTNAKVVLGSATPSLEAYYEGVNNNYKLYTLEKRAISNSMANVHVVDLREELKEGNRSILSRQLQELIEDRLSKKQQIMLFLNRRGYESFVSCRSCGHVIKCKHCDVALNQHRNNTLVCHYCGYTTQMVKECPECGSKYIGGFKAGTQKIEMLVKERFPGVSVLRMDADTTKNKDGHEKILSAFANREADILIGTQMIVKGHDFSNVTLVGVLAADLSLYSSDFRSGERTFQLLTQAAGRAGRGKLEGDVVIQTYNPENYAVEAAKNQDYLQFYNREIQYRELMEYPPVYNMLLVVVSSANESDAFRSGTDIKENFCCFECDEIRVIGPTFAAVSKINDIYKVLIYIKALEKEKLVNIKDSIENGIKDNVLYKNVNVSFDFNPINFI